MWSDRTAERKAQREAPDSAGHPPTGAAGALRREARSELTDPSRRRLGAPHGPVGGAVPLCLLLRCAPPASMRLLAAALLLLLLALCAARVEGECGEVPLSLSDPFPENPDTSY